MAKKRINKAGHVFGGHVGGIDYFRQNDGKWTDSGGVLVEPGYAKILDQFFPQEIKDEKTPLKANKLPKKTRRPEPVIAPQVAKLEVQEPDTSALISAASNPIATPKLEKLKKEKQKKSKPEDEKAEDNPSRSKRILRAMYPDLFTTGEKLREIWTGKEEKEELEKKNKRKRKAAAKSGDDEEPDQEGSTRGGRIFDAMYPGVRKKAGDLKRIWTGDKNKNDEQQKEKSEKKRQEVDKRYNFEKIKDDLNDNGDYLRDLIVVQQRTANILSQILDKIDNLGGSNRKDNDLPDKKKFNFKNNGTGNIAKMLSLLPMMIEAADLTKEEIEEKLNAEANPAPDDIMNQPMTKVISDWWNGDKKKKEAAPVAAGPLSIQATGTGTVEELTAAMNAKAAGNGAPGAVSDIATSKETTAIAEAKQTQVKAENILTFKADEIKFNADRLTFEVQTLTIENKGQQPSQQSTGPTEGNSPAAPSGTPGSDTGTSTGGAGSPSVEGAPVTGSGPGKDKTPPAPTLTEEQKKDLGALTGEGIKADDPRAKQFSGLNDEQLKSAGIEKTPDGGFKQAPAAAASKTDEQITTDLKRNSLTPGEGATPAGSSFKEMMKNAKGNFNATAPGIMNNLMKDFNLTKEQASGIVGNLGHESAGLHAGINEGKPLVAGSRGGYGLAQWTGPRRKDLEKFAKDNELPLDSVETQYKFLKKELTENKGFRRILDNVRKEKTAEGSAKAFLPFETGGDPRAIVAMGSRNKFANQANALDLSNVGMGSQATPTEQQIAAEKQRQVNAEQKQRQTSLAGSLAGQKPIAAVAASTPAAAPAARPEMTAEDKKALAGEELTPTAIPDATKLPGGDEGLRDREVRSANMQHASNVAEKEPIVQQNVAKLESGRDGDTGGDDSWNKSGGGDAAPIPEPPRRPAELTAPPPEADNTPAPQPQRRPAEGGKNARQSAVESNSSTPGGNSAQFLETVFRMLPYLLHQKKHAPQAGRRWHY